MRRKTTIKSSIIVLLCAAVLSGCGQQTHRQYRVAMITKSTESAFFKSVFSGAGAAATAYNLQLTTEGPEKEEDWETQNEMIRAAVEDGADVLIFSAADYDQNAGAVNWAAQHGVPVVVIDSDVNSSAVQCRIGTDNVEAGRRAAEAALQARAGELVVGLVNFDENTANGREREVGFREVAEQDARVKEIYRINVDSTTEDARAGTKELLAAHPEINVIATFNEWTSLGVGWAIRDLGRKDITDVVAFDSNAVSVGMLETGEVDALIVQNPYAMGYLGVETAWKLLNGKNPDTDRIDTETTTATRENMFLEDYQKILFRFEQ